MTGSDRAVRSVVNVGKKAFRLVWRQVVQRRSIDGASSSSGRSALVVAPHPDDETIGCGALIARKRAAGTRVQVVFVTDGRYSHQSAVISPDRLADIRRQESVEACRRLGVDLEGVHHLAWEEGTLDGHDEAIAAQLAALIANMNPDELLIPAIWDSQRDHKAAHRAALLAVEMSGYAGRVAVYPVWFWVDGPWIAHHHVNLRGRVVALFVDAWLGSRLRGERIVCGEFLKTKRSALEAYQSQMSNLSGESTWASFSDEQLSLFLRRSEILFPLPASSR